MTDQNGVVIESASHIGNVNPIRYRGYYYDTETKLYYLKTRYYDPEICRFVTIDDVDYVDPNGNSSVDFVVGINKIGTGITYTKNNIRYYNGNYHFFFLH